MAILIGTFCLLGHRVSGFGSDGRQAPGSFGRKGEEAWQGRWLIESRGWTTSWASQALFCPVPEFLHSGTAHPASVYQGFGRTFCAPGTVGTGLCLRESERSGHRPLSLDGLAHANELAPHVVQ